MYIVKQQLTMEFNAHVERLTANLTTRDATFVVERQKILIIVNTVIETVNKITTNYKFLHNQSSSSSLGSSSSSSQLSFSDIISTTRNHFKILFDKIMTDNNYSLDDMCNMVSVKICSLGIEKISKETIKNFHYNNDNFKGSTLNKIGAWIDSKNNFNLANNSE
ncbi:12373_t:CDS:2 [Cetraspora pellucida]|uniref:12373_t:CDS:1 n=1 Tax=Cetraspora pellucida TaxID=1433469 RepID=A0A9N8ZNU2_9GLOM|nr:12373_t:CDS:2 [Cetraspora pellucida]